jgi:5-methylcytosine-specific restriction endonuclease McrA
MFHWIKDRLQGRVWKGTKQLRAKGWRKVAKNHLREEPVCQWCGSKTGLEVHHIRPFQLFPELELDPTNLITLCDSMIVGFRCHLRHGHLSDYARWNPLIRKICDVRKVGGGDDDDVTPVTPFERPPGSRS